MRCLNLTLSADPVWISVGEKQVYFKSSGCWDGVAMEK